jgi:TatD DNase family protein
MQDSPRRRTGNRQPPLGEGLQGAVMKLFDSHCHLDDAAFEKDLGQVLSRAAAARIAAMLIAGTHLDSCRRAVGLAASRAELFAAVGIHPHDARHCSPAVIRELAQLATTPAVVAWGEMGLDFNRMRSPRADQEQCFLAQLEMADNLGLPVILHERDSQGRLLELLGRRLQDRRQGVVHCFSGSDVELEEYLKLGFHIGITGILTIKGRGRRLRQQVRRIPAHRLLVETDAPYLTPTPQRNKHRRNEPAFVHSVLLKLAEVRQENPEQLAQTVWDNTCRLFRIDCSRLAGSDRPKTAESLCMPPSA